MTKRSRRSYEGVAVTVPVTVPYVRYSTRGAHWFIGQAVKRLLDGSGLQKDQIDGLTVSSFSLTPDTAVGVTQHLGLQPAAVASGVKATMCSFAWSPTMAARRASTSRASCGCATPGTTRATASSPAT